MKKISGLLGFCLALLLPVVALAQGAAPPVQIVTGKGITGPLNPFPTSSVGPTGYVQGVTIANGGARVVLEHLRCCRMDHIPLACRGDRR